MLTEVDISLFIGAVLVSALSWRNPRGIVWIGVAALSYINATIAWRLALPYAEGITALGDTAVCLTVYFIGRERWEMLIWRLFQISVAISILYLAGNIRVFAQVPHEIYSIMMEAVNWLLLLLIGGVAVLQWVGAADDVGAMRPWSRVHRLSLALRHQRRSPAFHKV